MELIRRTFKEEDFLKVLSLLIGHAGKEHPHKNWKLDRWNFSRYFAQTMLGTAESWLETVGIWEDLDGRIAAVVNSEGEGHGEVFFQLFADCTALRPSAFAQFLEFAEQNLFTVLENGVRMIELRISSDFSALRSYVQELGYRKQEWEETDLVMAIGDDLPVSLPVSLQISDAQSVSNSRKGIAHARAFGYQGNDAAGKKPGSAEAVRAFEALRNAPSYREELDLSICDTHGEVAAFACLWFDRINKFAVLEPVGTIPEYRGMGLGRLVIYEGGNRVRRLGAKKIYVGSDQQFYKKIGFEFDSKNEIWRKQW